MITSMRGLMLALTFIVTTNCGIVDLMWNPEGDSKDGINPVCLAEDKVCQADEQGFQAINRLASGIDRDDDHWVSYTEAVQFVDNSVIEELKEGYRSMTTMLNYSSSVSRHAFWNKWSTSVEYRWNSNELADWVATELGHDNFRSIIIKNSLIGKDISRFTEADGAFIMQSFGEISARDAEFLKNKSVALILFGEKTFRYAFYTLMSFILTSVAMYTAVYILGLKHCNSMAKNDLCKVQRHLREKNLVYEDLKVNKVQLEKQLKQFHEGKGTPIPIPIVKQTMHGDKN